MVAVGGPRTGVSLDDITTKLTRRGEACVYTRMPRPIQIRTRQAISWRIPIELIDRLDEYRAKSAAGRPRERTECVVEALEFWLRTRRAK